MTTMATLTADQEGAIRFINCPTCGAKAGHQCTNDDGSERLVIWTHFARLTEYRVKCRTGGTVVTLPALTPYERALGEATDAGVTALLSVLPSAAVAPDADVRRVLLDDCRGCGRPLLPGIVRYCSVLCAEAEEGPDADVLDDPDEDDR